MKKMNKIYEAPKAEVIELGVYKPFMQIPDISTSTTTSGGGSSTPLSQDSGALTSNP